MSLNAIWVQPNAPPQSGEERDFVFARLISCVGNSRSCCLFEKNQERLHEWDATLEPRKQRLSGCVAKRKIPSNFKRSWRLTLLRLVKAKRRKKQLVSAAREKKVCLPGQSFFNTSAILKKKTTSQCNELLVARTMPDQRVRI